MYTHQFNTHLEASNHIRSFFTWEAIQLRWNESKNGKHAKVKTVRRWLTNGPDTKNRRFEPWLLQWAEKDYAERNVLQLGKSLQEIAEELDLTRERVRQLQVMLMRAKQV